LRGRSSSGCLQTTTCLSRPPMTLTSRTGLVLPSFTIGAEFGTSHGVKEQGGQMQLDRRRRIGARPVTPVSREIRAGHDSPRFASRPPTLPSRQCWPLFPSARISPKMLSRVSGHPIGQRLLAHSSRFCPSSARAASRKNAILGKSCDGTPKGLAPLPQFATRQTLWYTTFPRQKSKEQLWE
jgi:hypothetical protein